MRKVGVLAARLTAARAEGDRLHRELSAAWRARVGRPLREWEGFRVELLGVGPGWEATYRLTLWRGDYCDGSADMLRRAGLDFVAERVRAAAAPDCACGHSQGQHLGRGGQGACRACDCRVYRPAP